MTVVIEKGMRQVSAKEKKKTDLVLFIMFCATFLRDKRLSFREWEMNCRICSQETFRLSLWRLLIQCSSKFCFGFCGVVNLNLFFCRRDGDDLHAKINITLLEALTGFRKQIEHLDGHLVTIERSEVTIPGQKITVTDEGMPLPEYGSEKGDLIVTVHVVFPKTATAEQKEQLKTLFAQIN